MDHAVITPCRDPSPC